MSFFTGGKVAREILDANHVTGVIVIGDSHSPNQYDPKKRVISLSLHAFHRRTPEAVAIGAHEAGHAIQHAERYWLFMIRAALFPLMKFAALFLPLCLLTAALLHSYALLMAVLWTYAAVIAFHLLALRIEYDASNRAYMALIANRLVEFGSDESKQIQQILNGFLWNYIWSFALSPLWLIASLIRRGVKTQ